MSKEKFNLIAEVVDCWCENDINKIYFLLKVNDKLTLIERRIIDYNFKTKEKKK